MTLGEAHLATARPVHQDEGMRAQSKVRPRLVRDTMSFSSVVQAVLNTYMEPNPWEGWAPVRAALAAAACTVLGCNTPGLVDPVVEAALDELAARRAGHGGGL